MGFALHSVKSNVRSANSQSSTYSIALTRLSGLRSRPNPHLKFVEVTGIEPTTTWSVARQTDPYTNEAVARRKYPAYVLGFV